MGTVAVVGGSHASPALSRLQETYGSCDLEREGVAGRLPAVPRHSLYGGGVQRLAD